MAWTGTILHVIKACRKAAIGMAKRCNGFLSNLVQTCACVYVCARARSGFARLLGIRVYIMDQLFCVLLYALACKHNFTCSSSSAPRRNLPRGSKGGRKIVKEGACVSKHELL
jgi:hypothetical protein